MLESSAQIQESINCKNQYKPQLRVYYKTITTGVSGTTKINFDLIRLSKDQAETRNCFKLRVEISIHSSKGRVQRKIYLPSTAQSDSFESHQFA